MVQVCAREFGADNSGGCYLHVFLESLYVGDVRRGLARFYGAYPAWWALPGRLQEGRRRPWWLRRRRVSRMRTRSTWTTPSLTPPGSSASYPTSAISKGHRGNSKAGGGTLRSTAAPFIGPFADTICGPPLDESYAR